MSRRAGLMAANGMTAIRVLLAPAFVTMAIRADDAPLLGWLVGAIFVAVAASDVMDGRLARRWASTSNAGRTFDHLADITFILSAFGVYVVLGIAPWWVPAAIAASFAFYVLDSWSRPTLGPPSLIGSRIGHAAGVMNYTLIGVLTFNNSAGIGLLSPAVLAILFWLVPLYSTAAVLTRLAARRGPLRQDAVRVAGSAG
jgi:phosphatidylglycerophosphate synthase